MRTPDQAIKQVLVHEEAKARFPQRVSAILERLSAAQVTQVPDLEPATIASFFSVFARDQDPGEAALVENKTSSGISAGKRFMVIGTCGQAGAIDAFIDTKGMVCHGFHNINAMANGCVFNCQYCFLQEHIWDKPIPTYVRLNVDYEQIIERMRQISDPDQQEGQLTRFQMGVLMDSYIFEPITGFARFLFEQLSHEVFSHTTIEMLSKSDEIGFLLDGARQHPWLTQRILPGFSINSVYVSRTYELGTAGTEARLAAARALQDAGYSIILRMDPVVPYDGWEADYRELVDMIFARYELRPQPLIIASLRFDELGLINIAKERFPRSDLFDFDFPREDRAKYRIPFERRMEVFASIIDRIRFHHPTQPIGICKENLKTWEALGMDPTGTCLSSPCLPNTMDEFVLD